MGTEYIILIAFVLLSVIFSFLCSVWEAVLLSIPPSRVAILLKEGTSVGQKLKEYKDNIDRPLAAILTLNTIAHTVGAIGVGAQATSIWQDTQPFIASTVVPVVMTMVILILSEIIPKTIGANYWKSLIPFTVRSLTVIITLLAPLVWLCQIITKSLKKDKKKSVLSRADFSVMTEIGEKAGIFKKGESKIIHNLLHFSRVQARDIMTPRTVVIAASETTTIQEFYDMHRDIIFSRIPIFNQTKDNITGFVLKDKVFVKLIDKQGEDTLKTIARDIMIVNDKFPLPDLFSKFVESKEHIALVVDEFGGMSGIVSMEDVIETLLGLEIVDEYDDDTDMQVLARKNWEKRARHLGLIKDEPSTDEQAK